MRGRRPMQGAARPQQKSVHRTNGVYPACACYSLRCIDRFCCIFDYHQPTRTGNMLTNELVEALLTPIGEASPCGDDLEYDAAFTALAASSERKPEQQFGDTVIPAVEPEWRDVAEQAEAILRRSKDVRAAVLLLRASTRMQGMPGFVAGLQLLIGLFDRFWDGIHPTL